MSWQSTYTCDVCGTVKKETNHWLTAARDQQEIYFRPWRDDEAKRRDTSHLCGETCAATHLSRYVSELKEKTS